MAEAKKVVKLGGSLLSLPDLDERLQRLFAILQTPVVVIPGGGGTADIIRRMDRQFQLSPAASHDAAVAAMGFNAGLLVRTGKTLRLIHDPADLRRPPADGRIPVLDVYRCLNSGFAERTRALPAHWGVTSDSIAASLATEFGFSHLLLLKSCEPASRMVTELSAQQAIDEWFPKVCQGLQLEWCNLRADEIRFQRIEPA